MSPHALRSTAVACLIAIMAIPPAWALSGCRKQPADRRAGELVIFHAGSLSVPIRQLVALFNEKYPDVAVKSEAAGSRDCARKVRDLHRRCDVLASADYKVVENLLMPDHAAFNIVFATNEMTIAYTDRSRLGERIDTSNWYDILLDPSVAVGRSDPNRDPCGYRTVMVFQLAERHYKAPGLARRLEEKGHRRYIRPKETDLLALLEAGEIDYLFIYRSVARQHGLKTLRLPDEVNLSSPALAATYATARVKVSGTRPGAFITRTGAPIAYSVTIPTGAANRTAAEAFVALLLSDEGRRVLEAAGQPAIQPVRVNGFDKLPPSLKALCEQENS